MPYSKVDHQQQGRAARYVRCLLSTLLCVSTLACGSGGSNNSAAASPSNNSGVITPIPATNITRDPVSLLHTEGTYWIREDNRPVQLKGVNLGNWLIQEFWMMGQGSAGIDDQCKLEAKLDARFGYAERDRLYRVFRDNWMTTRDWDMIAKFNLNMVRLPFIWSVVEDEKNPGHLRSDAWVYLDQALAEAEKRGIYVILDLHGAVGSQGWEHHSGCAGKNLFWSTPEYQQRTQWLWQQVAGRYKDRAVVAGYSLLNEPWGASETEMANVVKTLYNAVRSVDSKHVVILPGHAAGINAYGNPAQAGMKNVAFEMHFYPGFFGWGQPGLPVHKEWLYCGSSGNGGVCEWNARLKNVNTAFLVGEFQPWAAMGAEAGGQVTRTTYDVYVSYGWASSAWSYKLITNAGGQGNGTWGLVTNTPDSKVPALDFNTASMAEIEALFKQFGSVNYEPQQSVMSWMNASNTPKPFN